MWRKGVTFLFALAISFLFMFYPKENEAHCSTRELKRIVQEFLEDLADDLSQVRKETKKAIPDKGTSDKG